MDMTSERWIYITKYLQEVFTKETAVQAAVMRRAVAEGLPDIAVSPETGRFLQLMTSMAGRTSAGADLALELGTLAGYSASWIARGLSPQGRIISIEYQGNHVAQAERTMRECGLGERASIRHGKILELLPKLSREIQPGSVDVVFIDALKSEYPQYLQAVLPLVRVGGILMMDNALASRWTIDAEPGTSDDRDAMDAFNRIVANHPQLLSLCVPIGNGVTVAKKLDSRA